MPWWAVRGSNSETPTPRSCHFNGLRRREHAHVYRSGGPEASGVLTQAPDAPLSSSLPFYSLLALVASSKEASTKKM